MTTYDKSPTLGLNLPKGTDTFDYDVFLRQNFNTLDSSLADMMTDVKLYGAKGDGTTDDTIAIQTALSHIQANLGKTLYFPAGTYKLTQPIQLFDNLRISGDGMATILQFGTGINGIVANASYNFVSIENMKIRGTNVLNANENGIYINAGSAGMPKLKLSNLQIEQFGNMGAYLFNCWDGAIDNVNVSSNLSHGIQMVNCFSAHVKKIVAYRNQGYGIYVQSAAGSLFSGTSQENYKNGLRVESAVGCTFQMYLEQNGWSTATDTEMAQFMLTQRSGGYKPSSGNKLNVYAIGGLGSTSPSMQSKYGYYLDFAYNNELSGNLGGHVANDIYMTSNSQNNKITILENATGYAGGDTPTPIVNNGSYNGYLLKGNVKGSQLQHFSFASQASSRTVSFPKAFTSTSVHVVGTVYGSTALTGASVKINNITATGFDFFVTDGTTYINGATVYFIAMGE